MQHILRVMEHAGSVADLLADVEGERREEVLGGQLHLHSEHPPPPQSTTYARAWSIAAATHSVIPALRCAPGCQAFKRAMDNARHILEQTIDALPPESGAHAHRDTYVAAAKLDLAADK